VDLELLESPAAAEVATRRGVERLLSLALQRQLAALAKRAPAPLPRRDGMPVPRAQIDAFRPAVVGRALRAAAGLGAGAPPPRTSAAFDARCAAGAQRIEPAFERLARAVGQLASELGKTELALRAAASEPSGTHAARDIRAQLDELFPPDWLESTSIEQLEQFPRYLRAAQQRLARAIQDPRRDADKYAPFAVAWKTFADKRTAARDRAAVQALRWRFEELRVALFAPELDAVRGVNLPSIARAVEALA
jgi:ATP-dependent helicase HrpA